MAYHLLGSAERWGKAVWPPNACCQSETAPVRGFHVDETLFVSKLDNSPLAS